VGRTIPLRPRRTRIPVQRRSSSIPVRPLISSCVKYIADTKFSLPVPGLYIDIFQKIKSLGYNCVSFYVDWALLEGKPGVYRADGIFDLQPFYDAAQEAGIWLIARPGPYINAEASGGGFPGWLQRVNGMLRTRAPDFLNATDKYGIVRYMRV
jgi:hypothetical protein